MGVLKTNKIRLLPGFVIGGHMGADEGRRSRRPARGLGGLRKAVLVNALLTVLIAGVLEWAATSSFEMAFALERFAYPVWYSAAAGAILAFVSAALIRGKKVFAVAAVVFSLVSGLCSSCFSLLFTLAAANGPGMPVPIFAMLFVVFYVLPFIAVLLFAAVVLRSGREEEEEMEEGRFDRLALAAVILGLMGAVLACHGGMRYSEPEDMESWERLRIPGSPVSVMLPRDRSVINREGMVGMQAMGKKMTVIFLETEEEIGVDLDTLVRGPVYGEVDGAAYEEFVIAQEEATHRLYSVVRRFHLGDRYYSVIVAVMGRLDKPVERDIERIFDTIEIVDQ